MADPPPAPAVESGKLPNSTQPAAPSKKMYSIFAPRAAAGSAPGSASTSTTPALHSTAAPTVKPDFGLADVTDTGERATSVSAPSATGTETVSLVDQSGESDGAGRTSECDRRIASKAKGKTKEQRSPGAKTRPRRVPSGEDEVVVIPSSAASTSTATGKSDKAKARASRTGANAKVNGKGKKRAPAPVLSDSDESVRSAGSLASTPRTPTKRHSRTLSASAARGEGVVDLTRSPPHPRKKKKWSERTMLDAREEETAWGSGSLGHAFSDERRAARERAKRREPPEARWPSREEHEGGLGQWTSTTPCSLRDAWNTRWPPARGYDNTRVIANYDDLLDADAGCTSFLDDLRDELTRSLHASPSPRSAKAVANRRPLSTCANLVPAFASHPLLDRIAAPLRAPTLFPSDFVRPTDSAWVPSEESAKLWTAKYGPQCADEMLGDVSRQSAKWLRDWLEELKVQSVDSRASATTTQHRRPIARGILRKKKKKKKRKALDDFIASSDDDEDNIPVDVLLSSSYGGLDSLFDGLDDDDGANDDASDTPLQPSSSGSLRRTSSVFPTLTNLILLHGPHGTGKTAAVHAVARELGYEVFEVFPGMGKRGTKDLERYVGDVGRNHVVVGGSPKKGQGVSVAAMFQRAQAKAQMAGDRVGGNGVGAGVVDQQPLSGGKMKGPMQSLILVDEVDVLFKHEEDFWQGLIALAQESRRPIIMTCTDDSLIPFQELGLQQVVVNPTAAPVSCLSFAAPSPDVAVPYLQLVALREGHILAEPSVKKLYSRFSRSRPYPAWLTQQEPGERPLPHPLSSMPLPSNDLRRALMQLQFECGWLATGDEVGTNSAGMAGELATEWCELALRDPDEPEDAGRPGLVHGGASPASMLTSLAADHPLRRGALEHAVRAADALSFADAHVSRRITTLIEDDDTGRFATPGDAEESFPVLECLVLEERRRLPFIGAEPDMAQAIESLSFGLWSNAIRFNARQDEELEFKRSDFTFNLGQLVHSGGEQALLQPPAPVLPSATVVTDYRPYLRAITIADDAHLATSALASAAAAEDGGSSELHALGMAAALAAAPGGSRKTRKSVRQKAQQGKPMYERVLDWASETEAQWLRESGFP